MDVERNSDLYDEVLRELRRLREESGEPDPGAGGSPQPAPGGSALPSGAQPPAGAGAQEATDGP